GGYTAAPGASGGAPVSPYGPAAGHPGAGGELPPAYHPAGAADAGVAGLARPNPYAASTFQGGVASTAAHTSRRPIAVVAIALGAVAVMLVAAITVYNAFNGARPGPIDPGGVFSEEWETFPGVSWADPDDILRQPSYEDAVAETDRLLGEYRDQLSEEFGLVWTMQYESYTGLESNGYGGDSMLYYYDSGSWQGQARVDDPGARARILELFTELSAANGGDGVLLRNDLYSDDPETSLVEFGAAELDDQALWSFFDAFDSLAGGYLSVDVLDRNLPVDDTFDGDWMFTFDESTNTLYVTLSGFIGALLKEGDRAEFEEALEPYHGDYEP
nr:hypothetical protein [Actinomycetota bacterium]